MALPNTETEKKKKKMAIQQNAVTADFRLSEVPIDKMHGRKVIQHIEIYRKTNFIFQF